jgi:hypothetical protein
LEHNSETDRSFSRRHGEVAEEAKATDERHRQEATQHDFERGVMYERSGDGDGTVTFRRPAANAGPGQNQSEEHLPRIGRERYVQQLETRLTTTNATTTSALHRVRGSLGKREAPDLIRAMVSARETRVQPNGDDENQRHGRRDSSGEPVLPVGGTRRISTGPMGAPEPPIRRQRQVLLPCCSCTRHSTCKVRSIGTKPGCPCRDAHRPCVSCACKLHCTNFVGTAQPTKRTAPKGKKGVTAFFRPSAAARLPPAPLTTPTRQNSTACASPVPTAPAADAATLLATATPLPEEETATEEAPPAADQSADADETPTADIAENPPPPPPPPTRTADTPVPTPPTPVEATAGRVADPPPLP